jgi:hypothetical protein
MVSTEFAREFWPISFPRALIFDPIATGIHEVNMPGVGYRQDPLEKME